MAMEFGQVLRKLFVGSCPENAADIQMLRSRLGVTAVLNLQTDSDIEHENLDWAELQATYRQFEIGLHRVPIRDFDSEELRAKLPEAAGTLRNLLRDGHTVYVHCTMGWNRSPTVTIAFLHWYRRWSLKRAAQHTQACKDCDPALHVISGAIKPADARPA